MKHEVTKVGKLPERVEEKILYWGIFEDDNGITIAASLDPNFTISVYPILWINNEGLLHRIIGLSSDLGIPLDKNDRIRLADTSQRNE